MCRMCIKLPLDSGLLSANQRRSLRLRLLNSQDCFWHLVQSGVVTKTLEKLGFGRERSVRRLGGRRCGRYRLHYALADIETGHGALTEHMQYVGALCEKDALAVRVRCLVEGEAKHGIVFWT